VGATPILALLATAVHTLGYIVWSLALVLAGIATVAI
jgi:hypothetical protein